MAQSPRPALPTGASAPVELPSPAAPAGKESTTRQSRETQHEPRLPHEHDESADSQQRPPGAQAKGEQALADVSRGLVDTDAGRRAPQVMGDEAADPPPDVPERKRGAAPQMSKSSPGSAPKAR